MVVDRAMLRRIYDWCIDAADKPYALWILGAVSFAESSFFPVPPDIMLLPMSLARPRLREVLRVDEKYRAAHLRPLADEH
jgi:membrane protein YqaA with SNARE-associated domain